MIIFFRSRILWKKNEVADYEATTFAIFYNNALYLLLVLVLSFFLLKSFDPSMYPLNYDLCELLNSINSLRARFLCML